ncbi:MAG: Glycine betaine/L-proline transport substrate-binding protein ProX [uncultured Rubrobacteraceae bacterium]|uniref:Glycine betaine/L-proline transport substrate-binding protein ProX n=1 Tax=uncultured Rubrobacteraceae bacterium TaxID=349277 RepID=A0A6J4PTP3_9ACTN|nr:MAG: Glycine betaine/L-proline transport substrate-binding protein ProX [uncultured Rubrobacteraceae bacterium]
MQRTGRFVKAALLGLLLVMGVFILGACGGGGGGSESSGSSAGSDETVNFGTVDWPEAIAKTNVASTVVEALGYQTDISEVSVPLVFQGLETGDLDVFVEAWFPTMQTNMDEIDQESVTSAATNLPEATFSVAVNREACDAGVTSHEDLDQFTDRFEAGGTPTIYGIEPGNDGNQVVIDMIENDTYGLGDWEIVESSTNGMLSEVESRLDEGQWVAFTGWEPHWMNNKFDMCLLEDPEEAWGGKSHVETLLNAEFSDGNPELDKFFGQMIVNKDIQANLIDQIDNSGKEPEQVALDWLNENTEITDQWLDGVKAADGTDGAEALRSYLEEKSA